MLIEWREDYRELPVVSKIVNPIFFLLISLLSVISQATILPDLFSATIKVSSRDKKDFNKGVSSALTEVIAKCTGKKRDDILTMPILASDINQAAKWVDKYNYEETSTSEGTQLLLNVSFPEKHVIDLIQRAQLAYWSADRPSPLLLVVKKNKDEVELLSKNEEFVQLVSKIENQFGLKLIRPTALSLRKFDANKIWQLNIPHIESATRFQPNDGIVILKLNEQAFDTVEAQWFLYEDSDDGMLLVDSDQKLGIYLNDALDQLFYWLVKKWRKDAVKLSSDQDHLQIKVVNVDGFNNFSRLLDYLKQLTVVKDVMVLSVHGKEIELAISLNSSTASFNDVISKGKRLTTMNQLIHSEASVLWWNG